MKTVVTHNGSYHPDDVFAVASIMILEGEENVQVIRTRDEAVINQADWVVDVGGEYDPERLRFDHHQHGAPVRDNGIPYASFGLVWKHFGEQIAGDAEVARVVEERLCQAIDAPDNGISLFNVTEHEVEPVLLFHVLNSFKPVWGSDDNIDDAFIEVVKFVKEFLERFIKKETGDQAMLALIDEVYQSAEDKSVLVFDEKISSHALIKYPDVKAVVHPAEYGDEVVWSISTIPKHHGTFENRVSFPTAWAGLQDEELEEESGIEGLFFCHKGLFVAKAKTKEAAIKATEFLK